MLQSNACQTMKRRRKKYRNYFSKLQINNFLSSHVYHVYQFIFFFFPPSFNRAVSLFYHSTFDPEFLSFCLLLRKRSYEMLKLRGFLCNIERDCIVLQYHRDYIISRFRSASRAIAFMKRRSYREDATSSKYLFSFLEPKNSHSREHRPIFCMVGHHSLNIKCESANCRG